MKLLYVSIIISLVCVSSIYSQKEWTLEECINYALENNIQVKQQELNTFYTKSNYDQSKINLLPDVNAGASHAYSFGRALDETTYRFTEDTTIQSNYFYIGGDLLLFKGLSNWNNIQKNKYEYLASKEDLQKMKNDISLQIVNAYLQILFDREILNVAKNQYELSTKQVERTKQLVDAGTLAQGAFLEIQAQAASEELRMVNAENQLELSYLRLKQLLELGDKDSLDILIPELEIDGNQMTLQSVDATYAEAESILPEIRSAGYKVESSQKDLAMARGGRSPQLSFSVNLDTRYSDARRKATPLGFQTVSIGQVEGTGQNVVANIPAQSYGTYPFSEQIKDNLTTGIAFHLSIPIFNKWQIHTQVKNAKIAYENSRLNLENTKNVLYKNIQQSYADARASLKRYYATLKALESMEEAFRYTQEKFDVGMVNSMDYNTAKNNLTKAQSELLQAKYEFILRTKILDFYKGNPIVL